MVGSSVIQQKINQQKQLFQAVMAPSSLKMITTQASKYCNALSSQKHSCLKEPQMPMLVVTSKMSVAVRTHKLQTIAIMDKIIYVLVAPLWSLHSQVQPIRLMIVNLVVQVQFVAQQQQPQRVQLVTIVLRWQQMFTRSQANLASILQRTLELETTT